ncbi:MAG: Clp protease N-terminal domain-containing protein, partial [Polyangiales bacterium]
MLLAEPRALLRKLDSTCTRALEAAAGACIGSSHYEVTVEHMLLALLDDRHSDVTALFEHYRIDLSHARSALQHALSDMRSGNPGKPTFSTVLLEWVQDAWLFASTELSDTSVRSGALLVRLVMSPSKYVPYELPV